MGHPPSTPLRIGTRGSQLARAQTAWVAARLGGVLPAGPDTGAAQTAPRTQIIVITTAGDQDATAPMGTGVFVKEIQQALLDGRIDLAVHSLKDLPTDPTPGLAVTAIPLRADPRDALVGARLAGLAPGARVGTGSPRRAAQLRRIRHDLELVGVRGNIATRIERARRGEVAAVMLAAAGLARLGLEADDLISTDLILPAPGQAALALEVRSDDPVTIQMLASLEHPDTRAAVSAERELLRELGGGCLLPVGAYARIEDGALVLEGCATTEDGSTQARSRQAGDPADPAGLGARVARALIGQGALDLLQARQ